MATGTGLDLKQRTDVVARNDALEGLRLPRQHCAGARGEDLWVR